MTAREHLLGRIEAFCTAHGMSEREFGYAAVDDGRFVERLRAGLGTWKVASRAEEFMTRQQDGVSEPAQASAA